MPKHFLSLADIDASELRAILDRAHKLKRARQGYAKGRPDENAPFCGETLALIFEKPSTRTRFSFDVAMHQLGGRSITTSGSDMQIGRGEAIADTAKVLSRYVDGIMLRAYQHQHLVELAQFASVPVINGLTEYNHPCQIIADLQTLEEKGGQLADMTLSWIGDGNNVAVSFVNGAAKFGYRLRLSSPSAYKVPTQSLAAAQAMGACIEWVEDPLEACRDTDVIITDTWVSMGDTDRESRLMSLAPYQVRDEFLTAAAKGVLFLHCLPAHRGEEVSGSVIDGPHSAVFDAAENRLHAQKAIICWCFSI